MKKLVLLLFLIAGLVHAFGQQKSMLDEIPADKYQRQKIYGAFKSTRVINAHSTEMLGKGDLDIRILHRFGLINQGVKQLFGMDQASMRLGADYGISRNMMIGLGRSTFRKELDAFIKYRVIQQAAGYKAVPFSMIAILGATCWTEQSFDPVKPAIDDRLTYYLQLVIGRKFTPAFSLQLSPVVLNSSRKDNVGNNFTAFALGGGGRLKFSKRMALTFDYHHVLGPVIYGYRSPLSVGVDIETGGHVFQLHFSNTAGMNERAYLAQTTGNFFKGDIRFGFNLSRLFHLGKRQ